MARSLSQVNPADAWKPASRKTWDLKWAAHLYRRAGFGFPPPTEDGPSTTWERLQLAVKRGQRETLDALLSIPTKPTDFDELMQATGKRIAANSRERYSNNPQTEKLQGWWLYRMLHTPHPLTERLTLFWHDHFATSVAKVRRMQWMYAQNELFRSHAGSKFGPFLKAVGRDPAMIVWLDSNSNIKGEPNENYGRELLELFSLGVGNYTEKDIQEAARAFTGWAASGGKFQFDANSHDRGTKTVLGKTGKLDGDDVVDVVLQQPACAKFLVRKLFREFISEAETPPDKLLAPLEVQLRKSGYNIGECVATMLRSRLFFSEHAWRARIKSPAEFVVGLVGSFDFPVEVERVARVMQGMGQSLFEPPNVKGWDGGKTWLNTATLLARHNFASKLLDGEFHGITGVSPGKLAVKFANDKSVAARVDFLLNLMLQGDVDRAIRSKLVAFANAGKAAKKSKVDDRAAASEWAAVAHTIATMPEFQLS